MAKKGQRNPKRIAETKTRYDARQRTTAGQSQTSESAHSESWEETPLAIEDSDWIQKHHAQLEKEYAGRWVAVAEGRVVGDGVRLVTALKRARENGVEHPLIHAFRPRRLRNAVFVRPWL